MRNLRRKARHKRGQESGNNYRLLEGKKRQNRSGKFPLLHRQEKRQKFCRFGGSRLNLRWWKCFQAARHNKLSRIILDTASAPSATSCELTSYRSRRHNHGEDRGKSLRHSASVHARSAAFWKGRQMGRMRHRRRELQAKAIRFFLPFPLSYATGKKRRTGARLDLLLSWPPICRGHCS